MQSFLSILEGLSDKHSQKAAHDDGNERNKKNMTSEPNFERNEEMRQTTSFSEGVERKKDEKPLVITKFNEFTNHSSTAFHMNRMLLSTSMKHVSVPSAFYKAPRETLNETYAKTSPILRASSPMSKVLTAKLIAASRLSKSATIMRSTGSMWMTKAPKSKAFPSYNMPVIDTSIMKFEDDFDTIEEVKDPEFCKIIDAATPKAKTTNHARNECKGNTTSPGQNVIDTNLTNRFGNNSLSTNHDLCGTNKSEHLDSTSMEYHTGHEIAFGNDLYGQATRNNPGQTVEFFKHLSEPQRKLNRWQEEVEDELKSASDECVLSDSGSQIHALGLSEDASLTCSMVSSSESTLSIQINESLENSAGPDDTPDDSEDVDDQSTALPDNGAVQFGEDSVFGILGVYCNSELHYR